MAKLLTFRTHSQNNYFYSNGNLLFAHPEMIDKINNNSQCDDDYHIRKLFFLETHKIFDEPSHELTTRIAPNLIKSHLGSLKQLLIEVTDDCNLACKYCGYRDLYRNYDERTGKKQSFDRIRLLIDYLAEIWKSNHNLSYDNTVVIGFYGGEPLLGIDLIRQTINYLENLNLEHVKFSYNITTNAMLLDKCMDFLQEKKITILISLDGNEYNHSYRVTKNEKSSFDIIERNIKKLKSKYPEYFEKQINFNAVLHNRNSYMEIYDYIQNKFGKIPRVAELNTNGISEDKEQEFIGMFQAKDNSNKKENVIDENTDSEYLLENTQVSLFNNFMDSFVGNTYNHLEDLFNIDYTQSYFPTGTCLPFQRKIFLTVNGKILPCERIGQEHPIGYVTDENVEIDFDNISNMYTSLYTGIIKLCEKCFMWNNCGQCMFTFKKRNDKFQCNGFLQKKDALRYLSENISVVEDYPYLQEKLIDEIITD